MRKNPVSGHALLAIICLFAFAHAHGESNITPTSSAAEGMANRTILIIGDSHMVHKDYLIDHLHESLTQQGAKVYSFGACGATPTDYLVSHKTDCGRASRLENGGQKLEEGAAVLVWNAKELIAKYNPNMLIIVVGDTLGAYRQSDFPKAWIWDEVSALTKVLKSANLACHWVGPPWGSEGGKFGKTFARVKQLSDYLSKTVSPCHYIDTTAMVKPGQWKSFDGQHLNNAGYKAWAAAITESIASPSSASAAAPAADQESW